MSWSTDFKPSPVEEWSFTKNIHKGTNNKLESKTTQISSLSTTNLPMCQYNDMEWLNWIKCWWWRASTWEKAKAKAGCWRTWSSSRWHTPSLIKDLFSLWNIRWYTQSSQDGWRRSWPDATRQQNVTSHLFCWVTFIASFWKRKIVEWMNKFIYWYIILFALMYPNLFMLKWWNNQKSNFTISSIILICGELMWWTFHSSAV